MVLALETWRSRVMDRDVLVFIDNDAARAALVNGASTNAQSAQLVHAAWLAAARAGCSPWFARVATAANPADGPSRGSFAWCHEHGFIRENLAEGCTAKLVDW